jgi:hypothetical protein
MKYLALLLLAFCGQAFAQSDPAFPVTPAQLGGAGSPAKVGVTEGIKWAAWTHSNSTRFAMVCRAVDHEAFIPETAHLKTPIATARAFWVSNVFTDCSTDPFMRPAYRAARAAFNLP